MQFSESWLRTFVNPPLSSEELSHLLTMAGLEVEKMELVAPPFDNVVVAQILTREKHPNADRLNLLTVDAGQGEPLSIVCGASNVTVGMKAPCAVIGAKLPGFEIKKAKVRGVESFGMMCSDTELGLAETSDGLLELPADAPVGQSIREYLDLDDKLFTLKLTPNRSDCLSLNGIAREVAALTEAELKLLPQPSFTQASDRSLPIKVDAVAACPLYTGRVISGVNAKAVTPAWMVRRLERSGLRCISALVDVTNYVLLEMGQPLHAFDLNKLDGGIEVRFARSGEKLRLLNEQDVELQPDMLVIADGNGPVALAGIMGGMDSAVDDATADIFLESAFFAPAAIIGKSRLLGLGSDSSYRFERGVDFAATLSALDRATQLITDICGGQAGPVVEACGKLPVRSPVRLRASRLHRVLGISLGTEEISRILSLLGMHFSQENGEFMTTPPSYRFDIAIEEDLIEEVARVYGYEQIPAAVPRSTVHMLEQPESQRPVAKLRQEMVLRDYQETINYSFVLAEWERDLCGNVQPIALQNPIASQMSVMRSSLLGGLIGALQHNLARKHSRVRLFEIGGCFSAKFDSYEQHERLAGVCYGQALPEQWGMPARNVDFYDVKGDIEALFAPAVLQFNAASHPASHPGRSAQIMLNDHAIGWVGELHPQWQQKFDLTQPLIWFEVSLDALARASLPQATEISRFPSVRRDLAVIVDETTTVQSLLNAMLAGQIPYVAEIDLFDLYRGKGMESGKKSLAFRVLLQDTQKTLTEAEIDQSMALLIEKLHEQGAQLRV